ncbi:hypothetical protein VM98_21095 [Streptomyces rubellomurinus subsp. indigoferus]|nr:hypothetical protein VM98_21095 [Streptomyces rubellomurinus subsp. indigoferus]
MLLLVVLLTLLPCAGQARALGAPAVTPPPAAAVTIVTATGHDAHPTLPGPGSGDPAATERQQYAGPQGHWILCTADGEPPQHNGCSSHPYCTQDAQLPNPPPQPQPALSTVPVLPKAPPRLVPAGLRDGPCPAPDLHVLQVQRS